MSPKKDKMSLVFFGIAILCFILLGYTILEVFEINPYSHIISAIMIGGVGIIYFAFKSKRVKQFWRF